MIGYGSQLAHDRAQWARQFRESEKAQTAPGAQEALKLARALLEHCWQHGMTGWTFDGMRIPPDHPGAKGIEPSHRPF